MPISHDCWGIKKDAHSGSDSDCVTIPAGQARWLPMDRLGLSSVDILRQANMCQRAYEHANRLVHRALPACLYTNGELLMTLQRKPEWSFQKHVYDFLERAVLEPREIRSIDKAGAQRSVGAWSAAVARGVKDGTGDILAVQGPLHRVVAWLECKSGNGKARAAQVATAKSYLRCGIPTIECRTIHDVLAGMRDAGFQLHGNADNLAAEYQERVAASERERALGAPKKRTGRSRRRMTERQRKAAQIYARTLLG